MKIYEILDNAIDEVEVPYDVWVCFGSKAKRVVFSGKTASLAEDFKSKKELRAALEWYVDQLGGKVKWDK